MTPEFKQVLAKVRSVTPLPESVPLVERAVASGVDREFAELVHEHFGAFDTHRYGMSFREYCDLIHTPKLQEEFQAKYGISFPEYILRTLMGEAMGLAMEEGRFKPFSNP